MKYDVFISYRREGGYDTAKHLNDLLVRDGYRVSFDIDTLRNGPFNEQLLTRIEQCKDFILIVNKHAFDKTLDPNTNPEEDWMRRELAHALKHKKNIIPIFLAGVSGFPNGLPEDIADVVKMNGPEYNKYYFDDFYKTLCSRFLTSRNYKKLYITLGIVAAVVGLLFFFIPQNQTEKEPEPAVWIHPANPQTTDEESFHEFINTETSSTNKEELEEYYSALLQLTDVENADKGIESLGQLAEQGHARALYCLGVCYDNGIAVEKDLKKAREYYLLSAQQGFAPAQNDYGISCVSEGYLNTTEAEKWVRKSAEQGYAPAQFHLAFFYANGVGVKADMNDFLHWIEKAVEQDYKKAKYMLASFYMTAPEEHRDVDASVTLLKELAAENFTPAINDLIPCYGSGIGTEKNIDSAMHLLRKAVALEYAPALTTLGQAYANPRDVPIEQNFDSAMFYLQKAAAQGYPNAMASIGEMYGRGLGMEKPDLTKAQEWMKKATDRGFSAQQVTLQNQYMQSLTK